MTCWACSRPTEVFYELERVPTGSCVLLDDAHAARTYPVGDLRLSHCVACGLVQNDAFDEQRVDYLSGYEASQAFSPTFVAFANRLIDGLTARYPLQQARVLEPGCGDGDFLSLLVDRFNGTGLGLDPAHVEGRIAADPRLEFRKEAFTPDSSATGDLIVCRHTLEHIRDLDSFMSATSRAAARTPGAVVMFEIPEATRIFGGGAFWDVYYEHATYFSPTSVRNLFRRHGLEPQHVRLEFDDQYIVVEAQSKPIEHHDEPDPAMTAATRSFADRVAKQVEGWNEVVGAHERTIVWGASSKAVGFLAAVDGITHAVDINPHKRGSYLAGSGAAVVGPDDVAALEPDLVIVMNPIYVAEIEAMLGARGVETSIAALE